MSPDGNKLYVADYSNFRVRSISLEDGSVSTIMGGDEEGAASGGAGANANIGQAGSNAYRPAGVAVSPDGKIILAADSGRVLADVASHVFATHPLPSLLLLRLFPLLLVMLLLLLLLSITGCQYSERTMVQTACR
jgi:hypothetical protein